MLPSQAPTFAPSSPTFIPSSVPSASPSSTVYKNVVTLFTFSGGSLSDSGPNADPKSQLEAPNGFSFVSGVTGSPSSAVYLNGNQYLSTTSSILPVGPKTISFWAKIDSSYGQYSYSVQSNSFLNMLRRSTLSTNALPGMYLLGFGTGCGSSFLLMLNTRNGKALFEVQARCDSQRVTVGPGIYAISDFFNVWTHFVVSTSDAGGTSLYINGNLLAHVSQSITHTNVSAGGSVLGIGTVSSPSGKVPYTDTNTTFFIGALDNIGIYDVGLSAAEVAALYNEQRPDDSGSKSRAQISTGAVIGAVIGAIAGALLCAGLIYYICISYKRDKSKNDGAPPTTHEANPYASHPPPASTVEFTEGNLTLITAADVISATSNFDVAFLVGRGTSAEVYRATMGGRSVAVKKLDIGAARSASLRQQQQLVHELNMCANYQHPNILPLLGVVTDPQCLCLVYPLQELGTLSDMLNNAQKRHTYLRDWRVRLCLGIDIASALDYLHTASSTKPCIVHRDVKLTNILMVEEAGRLGAILCDLGIARVFQEGGTLGANTMVMGTLGYIDPQYAMGHLLSKSSDIFAAGVVLLQLLTGISEAFNRNENPPALYLRMRPSLRTQSATIAEPGVWPPEVAEYLGYLVSLCTSDAISDRPDSCRTVAANLRAMIDIFNPVLQSPQRKIESYRLRQRECIICFGEKGPLDCRLVPCLHSCVCSKDAELLIETQRPCPLCRVPLQSIELGQFEHTNTM